MLRAIEQVSQVAALQFVRPAAASSGSAALHMALPSGWVLGDR